MSFLYSFLVGDQEQQPQTPTETVGDEEWEFVDDSVNVSAQESEFVFVPVEALQQQPPSFPLVQQDVSASQQQQGDTATTTHDEPAGEERKIPESETVDKPLASVVVPPNAIVFRLDAAETKQQQPVDYSSSKTTQPQGDDGLEGWLARQSADLPTQHQVGVEVAGRWGAAINSHKGKGLVVALRRSNTVSAPRLANTSGTAGVRVRIAGGATVTGLFVGSQVGLPTAPPPVVQANGTAVETAGGSVVAGASGTTTPCGGGGGGGEKATGGSTTGVATDQPWGSVATNQSGSVVDAQAGGQVAVPAGTEVALSSGSTLNLSSGSTLVF